MSQATFLAFLMFLSIFFFPTPNTGNTSTPSAWLAPEQSIQVQEPGLDEAGDFPTDEEQRHGAVQFLVHSQDVSIVNKANANRANAEKGIWMRSSIGSFGLGTFQSTVISDHKPHWKKTILTLRYNLREHSNLPDI